MKRIVFFFIFLIIGCASILFQQQNEIIEEVSTDYWVVPLFAVDKDGKGVMDLNAPDIEVTVNNKKIENFTLLRRNFSTENNTPSNPVIEPSNTGFTKPISTVSEKTRHVFLFFDTSFSSAESTRKSKIIARKLVENASNNTIFYVLGIEPLSGLIFYGGQTNDKTQIISIIDNIKPRANLRNPDKEEIFIPKIPNSRKGESDEEQIDYESKQVAEFYRLKIDRFEKSFESFYYAISPLKDNKFIYLFTQGISGFIQDKVIGGRSIIGHYISKISDSLGRSGAVLFIINPLFHDNLVSDRKRDEVLIADDSGDVALNFLAEKSGGKYFTGPETYIIERIEKMNNAYYEVFFPASLKSGSFVLNISIKSKLPHVDIYTINSTEKDKEYDRMEEIERQILMLNIVSGNLIYKPGLKILDAQYKDGTNKKDTVSYEVILPDSFQGKQLDIYKVRLNKKNTVPNIEKESLSNAPKLLKVSFKNLTEGDDTYFTIINPLEKTCLVKGVKKIETLIHRDNWGDNSDEWATTKGLEKENASTKIEDQDELHRLLKGTADYCERLKKAAFHYICKEKIEENQRPLDRNGPIDINIGDQSKDNWNSTIILRTYATVGTRKNIKNVFYYRLIKKGGDIRELREKIGKNDNETMDFEQIGELIPGKTLQDIRFLSSKSIFGPITILDAERQKYYQFRLIGHEKLQNRPCTIIEAISKSENDSVSLSGKLWIDSENFSVLKININPKSIAGNNQLRDLSRDLNTKLSITLETEFYMLHENLRFPTRIHFKEAYKGGPIISIYKGTQSWERTETNITYNDYSFFNVEADVIYPD